MKKLFLVLLLAAWLAMPAFAQNVGVCNVDPPAEPADVTMIGWTFPILDFYAEELAACDDVDNINVTTQILQSTDAQDTMRLAASNAGDAPYDIIHASNGFLVELVALDWVMPLNDLIEQYREEYDLDDMNIDVYADAAGNIYGIPIIVNTQHFFYNRELLEEAGIEPPETYDEVLEICASMDADALDIDMAFGIVVSADWAWRIEFVNLLGAYGGTLLDSELMPAFHGEEGVAAMSKLMELADDCLGEDGILLSTDDVQAGMANGSIAMAHLWASRAAMMDDEEMSSVIGMIEFAPALYPTAAQTVRAGIPWSDFLAIPANSPVDKDLLFRMIMETADLDSQIAAAGFGLVPRMGADEAAPRYSAASLQTIAEGGPGIDHAAIQTANAALGQTLPMVATGEATIQEALDAAAALYIENATAAGFIGE